MNTGPVRAFGVGEPDCACRAEPVTVPVRSEPVTVPVGSEPVTVPVGSEPVKPGRAVGSEPVTVPVGSEPVPVGSEPVTVPLAFTLPDLALTLFIYADQTLLLHVNSERSEFMRYLQEVARMCPDDYNYISQGAALYSEEYLRACLDQMRMYPQLYQIQEITSLTGGNFSSSLQLNFEKQLLTMGEVVITDHKVVPNEAQLAFDYETVSSDIPPVKKAKLSHSGVSTDSNAEKLSGRYEPHVVLSRESLVRLLDNHGPDFTDPWELPVVVRTNPGRGSSQSKTVYIDPPLLQTEMTVRERSLLFHEESMKLSVNKTGTKNVFQLMTETPAMNNQLPAESSQRMLVSFETSGLDFGLDLTDLETFGETTQSPKRLKTHNVQKDSVSQPQTKSKQCSGALVKEVSKASRTQDEEVNLWTNTKVVSETEGRERSCAEQSLTATVPSANQLKPGSVQEEQVSSGGDSEDERLVIDDPVSPVSTTNRLPPTTVTQLSPTHQHDTPRSPSASSPPPLATGTRRVARKAKVPGGCDQLGQILAMQKAMLKPSNNQTQDPARPCSFQPAEPLSNPNPQSLVKPCVSNYLESTQDGETYVDAPSQSGPIDNRKTVQQKRLLCDDLMGGLRMRRTIHLQRKETCCINCTVYRTCCCWCGVTSVWHTLAGWAPATS
nr:little elongation complex subunit 2 [Salvelinus alpinus]